jgi:hypothetical protein
MNTIIMIYLVTVFIWVARIAWVRFFDKPKYDEVFNDDPFYSGDVIKLLIGAIILVPVLNTGLLLYVVSRKITEAI